MCPKTQRVVASSYQEWKDQRNEDGESIQRVHEKMQHHPLVTNCLLAIQGVSRLERSKAMGLGMASEAFQKGQVS